MSWSKNKNTLAYQSQGTFTANGSTPVVFTPTVPLGPNSIIIVTYVSGTSNGLPFATVRTNGAVGTASLSFTAAAGNTAVFSVSILG